MWPLQLSNHEGYIYTCEVSHLPHLSKATGEEEAVVKDLGRTGNG